jgi:hypothetical protein
MLKIPIKLSQYIGGKLPKYGLDVTNPLDAEGVQIVIDIAKELIKPF